MNYFTEAWANNWITEEMTPKQQQAVGIAYRERLAQIWPLLPPEMQALAEMDLSDGLIRRIALNWSAQTLLLELRCGCARNYDGSLAGYFDLDIEYQQVSLQTYDAVVLGAIAGNVHSEVRYAETDIESEAVFVHRLLFSNLDEHTEVDIRFRNLGLTRTSLKERGDRNGWPAADFAEVGERPLVSLDAPRKERSGKRVSPWLPI